jgi:hypothetical protein
MDVRRRTSWFIHKHTMALVLARVTDRFFLAFGGTATTVFCIEALHKIKLISIRKAIFGVAKSSSILRPLQTAYRLGWLMVSQGFFE